jgi:hypothetical protein
MEDIKKIERKIEDLEEMKLLKQREIEWINRRIKYFQEMIAKTSNTL